MTHSQVKLEAAEESLTNLRQLTDSIDIAFLLWGLDPPAYLYVSAAFEKIYGFNPIEEPEALDSATRNVHADDWEELARPVVEAARLGLSANGEFRIIRPDGEHRWIRATIAPVTDSDGVVRRCAGTVEDITERKAAEAALRAAHGDAKRANEAKNDFLSRMSHELRTPMNAVLGFAQLLEMDDLPDHQRDAVTYILRGGRHLLGLIDDVLDITKIESDRLDVSMEPVLVSELLVETTELMAPMAATMDVTLRLHPEGAVGQYVHADRRRLRQVLLNLLSNAAKYNRIGGSIDVSCEEVEGGLLEIRVADTGHGIRPQDLPRLFTPFDRLGAQTTGVDGSGVGLALSQRLMANMRGSLRAQSEVNVGSIFTASVPTANPIPEPEPPNELGIVNESAATLGKPTSTLVYVEDNNPNVELMKSVLNRRPQWQMVVAGTGELGLALILSSPPDLVLLDLHLPDIDGSEVLRRLRADPRTSELRIIVISADANPHQIRRLMASGAHGYLTKPFDVANVLELLDANEHAPLKI